MDIPDQALQIMIRKLDESNTRFYNPDLFFYINQLKDEMKENPSANIEIKSIHGNPIKMLTLEEFNEQRKEELTIISIDNNGNFTEQTFLPKKIDEIPDFIDEISIPNHKRNISGMLGGGEYSEIEKRDGFTPIIEFHNHPMYLDHIHNYADLESYIFHYLKGLAEISCIGMVYYDGTKEIHCIRAKSDALNPFKDKIDALKNQCSTMKNEMHHYIKMCDEKYKNVITKESDDEIEWEDENFSRKEKRFIKRLDAKGDGLQPKMDELCDSIRKKMGISKKNTFRIMHKSDNIERREGICMLYPHNDGLMHQAHPVSTKEAVNIMSKMFEHIYGKWFDIKRIHL